MEEVDNVANEAMAVLLLTSRYTISEVGYMVSMSSQSYFRKCFKDEFHVNPSDYQKQVKS